jgi:hypothetical protein
MVLPLRWFCRQNHCPPRRQVVPLPFLSLPSHSLFLHLVRRHNKIRPSLRRSLRAGAGPPPPCRSQGTPPRWQGARASADPGNRSLRSPSGPCAQHREPQQHLTPEPFVKLHLRGGGTGDLPWRRRHQLLIFPCSE